MPFPWHPPNTNHVSKSETSPHQQLSLSRFPPQTQQKLSPTFLSPKCQGGDLLLHQSPHLSMLKLCYICFHITAFDTLMPVITYRSYEYHTQKQIIKTVSILLIHINKELMRKYSIFILLKDNKEVRKGTQQFSSFIPNRRAKISPQINIPNSPPNLHAAN